MWVAWGATWSVMFNIPWGSSCRDGAETSAFAAFRSGVAATECTSYTGFGQLIRGLERWQRNLRWCLPSWEVTWTNTKALFASMIFLFPVWWDMLVLWRVIILKTLEMFVFTRKLLHLEDANVRLDSENKNPELGWLVWLPPVFFQGCIHIYIPTGDFLHLFRDKSCEFSVEFIIWMSKVQHRPLNLSSFRVDLFP